MSNGVKHKDLLLQIFMYPILSNIMCGIFALLNHEQKYREKFVKYQFDKGKARGPENSVLQKVGCKITFGFHRLAINGLNDESNQPLVKGDITLICNGEIYNYRELYALMSTSDSSVLPRTQSDCEVILWLYERYGIEQTLQMLDGVFAFALLDQRFQLGEPALYLSRDPYGVRPLYEMYQKNTGPPDKECTIGFASELKMLSGFEAVGIPNSQYNIAHFQPGTYSKYVFSDKVCSEWRASQQSVVYHRMAFNNTYGSNNLEEILRGIRHHLTKAVEKRCSTTERPIACLLSGGLDSSLIAALVNDYHRRCGLSTLETYSIGLSESTDLKYAKMVADHLGTKHTEVVLTESEFCEAIPEVIAAIESYDTTTVRASIGNYLLGKYIAKHSEAKVIFNGDGSDELLGGYLYMGMAPDAIEFDRECRRLLTDIHAFDVLRSDKSISSHGLEPRTPFLDREWTQYVLSINPAIRRGSGKPEKYLLRSAFCKQRDNGVALLPDEVLWRRKEAFSDGVSGHERSLYQILQEYCAAMLPDGFARKSGVKSQINLPETVEQYLYREVFESCYPGLGEVVPYFWMPKYVAAKDASARTLAFSCETSYVSFSGESSNSYAHSSLRTLTSL